MRETKTPLLKLWSSEILNPISSSSGTAGICSMSRAWRGVSSATDESSLNISLLLITRCCGTAANGSRGPCGGKTGWATLRARSADSGRVRCFFAVIRREVIRVYAYIYTQSEVSTMMNDVREESDGIYRRWHPARLWQKVPSGCGEPPSLDWCTIWFMTTDFNCDK